MIFDWQNETWQRLERLRAKLPHAVLLHGRPGLGKSGLALEFARYMLCESPRKGTGEGPVGACGECLACGWFAQGNHPDFRMVQPESMAPEPDGEDAAPASKKKKSDQIRVEQIRGLEGFLGVGTHRGGLRVIVLDPAENMNEIAQNALLKSLEEPPPGTLFIMVTSHAQRLLPTIRSRCEALAVGTPPADAAAAWLGEQGARDPEVLLAQAGGAPLQALKMVEQGEAHAAFLDALQAGDDPLRIADRFERVEPAVVIGWLQRWVLDIFRQAQTEAVHYHPQRRDQLARLSARVNLMRLGRYERELTRARELASHPLNARLFLEELLIGYQAAVG